MNISSKGLAVGVIVVGGLIVGAYNFGSKQQAPKVEVATKEDSQQAVDLLPGQAESKTKFAHFRVGNRNVKGMFADGNDVLPV